MIWIAGTVHNVGSRRASCGHRARYFVWVLLLGTALGGRPNSGTARTVDANCREGSSSGGTGNALRQRTQDSSSFPSVEAPPNEQEGRPPSVVHDHVIIGNEDESRAPEKALEMWIRKPTRDAIVAVGEVAIAFETRGFLPSAATPVEIVVPQNGDTPMLVESGHIFTLLVDRPCTQLVNLFASVNGEAISTSVIFSTVHDHRTLASMRVPLPADAAWGVSLDLSSGGKEASSSGSLGMPDVESITPRIEGRPGTRSQIVEGGDGCIQGGLPEARLMHEPCEPLEILFVGSLKWDGQKHIWLQQMEGLPRGKFSFRFLTFEDALGSGISTRNDPVTWEATATEHFERRVRIADVPILRKPSPLLDTSCISLHDPITDEDSLQNRESSHFSDAAESDTRARELPLKEAAFKVILESFDRAGGVLDLMSPSWVRQAFKQVADAIKTASPDIVVVANARTLGDVVLTKAARSVLKQNGRIVMDFPNMDPAPHVDVDVIVTPSHYVARDRDIMRLARQIGAQVVVIPPGIKDVWAAARSQEDPDRDLARYTASGGGDDYSHRGDEDGAEAKSCADGASCFVIGFVGRLAPEKSPGLFLAAAQQIAELVSNVNFVIIGDGPLRWALQEMAARFGIAGRVRFAGWVDGPRLDNLFADMDILLNPSMAKSETFCVTNIEAMSAGTLVASFGIGGMLEYMSPGRNSLELNDPNPSAMAKTVIDVLEDPERLTALAERGRRDILREFRTDAALTRWATLYEAIGRDRGVPIPIRR